MHTVALSDHYKSQLKDSLRKIGSPYQDIEEFLLEIYPLFSNLPKSVLRKVFEWRNDPNEYGALLLENFPIDNELPETPANGRRSEDKSTFISEACILGVAQLLGQPIGYHDEKEGELVHNLCPVKTQTSATSNESSKISQGFHTDFNFDKENPDQPYNVINPDFVLLICLRADIRAEACTLYADVRDICRNLTDAELSTLRQPLFQFAASYSFTGKCGEDKIWSVPTPLIKGPAKFPELSIDLLCGVKPLSEDAEIVLEKVRVICETYVVASKVFLRPGDLLLLDNRKGAHGRTAFSADFSGYDRWVQRVYVRRSLWEMRKETNNSLRIY